MNRLKSIFASAPFKGSKIRVLSVLALFVLVVVLTAAAFPNDTLSVSQSNVTYYACVNNTTGAITIVSQGTKCPTGSHKIHWNQQGPQGVQGPTGPQGPQGPAGVSQGYYGSNGNTNLGNTIPVPVVFTTAVAAGTYIIIATEQVVLDQNDQIQCEIGTIFGASGHIIVGVGVAPYLENQSVTITDSVTVRSGDQIGLYCQDYTNDTNTHSFNAGISAIQLTSVQADLKQKGHPQGLKLLSHP